MVFILIEYFYVSCSFFSPENRENKYYKNTKNVHLNNEDPDRWFMKINY